MSLYMVDPPDCSNYAGRGRPARISRTVFGPKTELSALLPLIPASLTRGHQIVGDNAMVFIDSSCTATLLGRGVRYINKDELALKIAGRPLQEVEAERIAALEA